MKTPAQITRLLQRNIPLLQRSTRLLQRIIPPNCSNRRSSAFNTTRAESATGNNLPVSSRLSSTPNDANQRTAAASSKAARMFRTMLREPLKSAGETPSCVTLQRPPPDTSIFAPSDLAPSRIITRLDSPSTCAAKIPAVSPAAPPPMIATSTGESSFNGSSRKNNGKFETIGYAFR